MDLFNVSTYDEENNHIVLYEYDYSPAWFKYYIDILFHA